MRFAFIAARKAEHTVTILCRCLHVTRTGLTTAEREELARLRKENRELRTERDILKKAAAFFAKHQA